MRDESDDKKLMDAMPLEQQIRIGVGEATEPQCSEPQCSEATMSPALASNSRRISPPHTPNSKIYELKVCELEPRRRRVRAYDAPQVLLQREACGEDPAGLAEVFTWGFALQRRALSNVAAADIRIVVIGRAGGSNRNTSQNRQGDKSRKDGLHDRSPRYSIRLSICRCSSQRLSLLGLHMALFALLESCSHAPVTNSESNARGRDLPGGQDT